MENPLDRAAKYATGIIGLALLAHVVSPRNNSAKIIQEMSRGHAMMIKVMIGERIVEARDVPRFTELLGSVDDPTMTELFAGLSDTDLGWVETMLREAG